jgi:hypothetical protein
MADLDAVARAILDSNSVQSWVMEPGSSPNRRVPVSLG